MTDKPWRSGKQVIINPANLVRIDIRSTPRTRTQSLDQVMLLTDAGIEGEQRALWHGFWQMLLNGPEIRRKSVRDPEEIYSHKSFKNRWIMSQVHLQ